MSWYQVNIHSHSLNLSGYYSISVVNFLHLMHTVHSVLEKSLKMLEFGIKTSRPLKVLEN